jgi:HD-like signal output (HDOD) protein
MHNAPTGADALARMKDAPADLVVAEMRMPGMDGLAFLSAVKAAWPEAVRILRCGNADLPAVAKASVVAQQSVLEPCAPQALADVIERALDLRDRLRQPALQKTLGELGSLPVAPRMYERLTQALADPNLDAKKLGAIVRTDVAMTGRVLQFVNSAYYALARRITDVEAAIAYLGVNTLRHLALSLEIARSFGAGVDMDAFERHAVLTARLAGKLVVAPEHRDVAFSAGLLHDCGKLVLMTRLPDRYREVAPLAAAEKIPAAEAERRVLGAGHDEIGGYLLGLWGIPHAIVGAVALHHDPRRTRGAVLDPVGAVGVADLLAHLVAEKEPAAEHKATRLPPEKAKAWLALAGEEFAMMQVLGGK